MLNKVHADYLSTVGTAMKSNPKRFWTYIIKTIKASSRMPCEMFLNNVMFSSSVDIVNGFNLFFKSVFKPKSFMCSLNSLLCSTVTDVPIFKIPLISAKEMKAKI